MSRIPKYLKEKIDSIPLKPGVYKMKDKNGNIIYVGKSKTLKSRVKSYFYTDHEWNKLKLLVFHIHDIDFIVTDTHLEALILECALIKKLRPMYNSQLKNHEKYRYLKVNNFNKYKPITVVQERETENCFGPYRSMGMLDEIIKSFQNIYPIVKAQGTYEFTYKIFPENLTKDTFEKNRESLIEIFSSKECMLEFLSQIEKKMKDAASKYQFETASIYRDMQSCMKYLYDTNTSENNKINGKKVLIGEKISDGYKVFFISDGKVILKKKFKSISKSAIEEFLAYAKELEGKLAGIGNEKRDLDFRSIVYTEIKDQTSKAVVFLEDIKYLEVFIEKLIRL